MGDDTGVFAVVKRRNGKIGFPATLSLYVWRLGGFERGNFTQPILRKGVRTESFAPFLFEGGKGVSKYLHVFFCLNPFPNILEKCFYVKNKCSILRRK